MPRKKSAAKPKRATSKATSQRRAAQAPRADHLDVLRERLDETRPATAAVDEAPRTGTAGRPRKEIDERILAGLASIQCTYAEMAAVLGVSESLLARNYSELIDKERDVGKMSLRRAQFANALKGNHTMQIWLGKQYLGQRDKHEFEGGEGGVIPMLVVRREESELPLPESVRSAINGI